MSPSKIKMAQELEKKQEGSEVLRLHFLFFFPFSSVQFSCSAVSDSWRTWQNSWTLARQASLSITNSRSLPKPMSIKSVMPSNHLIFCRPLLLLPSIFPSIRVCSNESALHIRWPKYWSFSFPVCASWAQWTLLTCIRLVVKLQSAIFVLSSFFPVPLVQKYFLTLWLTICHSMLKWRPQTSILKIYLLAS